MRKCFGFAAVLAGILFVVLPLGCSNGSGSPSYTIPTYDPTSTTTGGDTTTGDGTTSNKPVYCRIKFWKNSEEGFGYVYWDMEKGKTANLPSFSDINSKAGYYEKFTKKGHYFAGWLLHSYDTQIAYKDGDVITPTKNMDLYACWIETPMVYYENGGDRKGSIAVYNTKGFDDDYFWVEVKRYGEDMYVQPGATVAIKSFPFNGYKLSRYIVKGQSYPYKEVEVTNGKFIMPEYDVYVDAEFVPIQ